MTDEVEHTAAALKQAFDESFRRPRAVEEDRGQRFLLVRAGQSRLAVLAADIGAVVRCPKIIPLPSRQPALLGLGGVRGEVVALYSVAALVDAAAGPVTAGWAALCGEQRRTGLVFDEVQGYVLAHLEQLDAASPAGAIHVQGAPRAVLRVPSILDKLRPRHGRDIHKE